MNLYVKKRARLSNKTVIVIGLLFLVTTTVLAIILYNNFHTIHDPIGLHEQELSQTIKGNFFQRPAEGRNLFQIHNSPGNSLFLPVYYIFSSIFTLIIIQNFCIILAGIILYKFTIKKCSRKTAIVFFISYILFPAFYYENIRNFSPIICAVFLVMGIMYFAFEEKWSWYFFFTIILLSLKENMSLIVFAIGVFVFFKFSKKNGVKTIFLSIVWLIISFGLIFSGLLFENYYQPQSLYSHLGTNGFEIMKTVITKPLYIFNYADSAQAKIYYLKIIFRHTAFISLIKPEVIAITVPILLQNLLSNSAYKFEFSSHYNFIVFPIIFIASVLSFERIKKEKRKNIFLAVIIIVSIMSFVQQGVLPFLKENCYLFDNFYYQNKCPKTSDTIGNSKKENYQILRNIIKEIPKDSSILTQRHIFSHFSGTNVVYCVDHGIAQTRICNQAEYVLFDKTGPLNTNIFDESNFVSEMLSIGYVIKKEEKDVILLKKTINENICLN